MSSFVIACPNAACGKPLNMPAAAVGQPLSCPHCGTGIAVTLGPDGRPNTPVAVKTGFDSPFAPHVSRRAGSCPCGSTSHKAPTYPVPSSSRVDWAITTRVPSGDSASAVTRGRAR